MRFCRQHTHISCFNSLLIQSGGVFLKSLMFPIRSLVFNKVLRCLLSPKSKVDRRAVHPGTLQTHVVWEEQRAIEIPPANAECHHATASCACCIDRRLHCGAAVFGAVVRNAVVLTVQLRRCWTAGIHSAREEATVAACGNANRIPLCLSRACLAN